MRLAPIILAASVLVGPASWSNEEAQTPASSERFLQQADQAIRDGRLVQAKHMIEWLDQNPDTLSSDDLALIKAEYAIAGNDIFGASTAIDAIKDVSRNICRQDSVRGWVALNKNELNKAILSFANAAKHCPGDAGIWNFLGLTFVRKGETAAAKQAFEQALQLTPENAELINNHALALVQQGELLLALQQLEVATSKAPENQLIVANRDFVTGMLGKMPVRNARDNDNVWSSRLINTGKGAKAAERTTEATALFSRALLLLDHFDDTVWTAMGQKAETKPR